MSKKRYRQRLRKKSQRIKPSAQPQRTRERKRGGEGME